MLKVEYIRIRPTTDIAFFHPLITHLNHNPDEFVPHWWETYRNTGKIIQLNQTLSEDLLTQDTTVWWEDRQSYDQAMSDPIVVRYYDALNDYNEKNNITNQGPTISEVATNE
jgi:hypothetical protein